MHIPILSIFVLVDVLGIIGAILVAIPFFREHGLREVLAHLERGPAIQGIETAENEAVRETRSEQERLHPEDKRMVVGGLITIAVSYGLHIVGEVLAYLHEGGGG